MTKGYAHVKCKSHIWQAALLALLWFASLPAGAEELVVSAAASLTNAFKEIGATFE